MSEPGPASVHRFLPHFRMMLLIVDRFPRTTLSPTGISSVPGPPCQAWGVLESSAQRNEREKEGLAFQEAGDAVLQFHDSISGMRTGRKGWKEGRKVSGL